MTDHPVSGMRERVRKPLDLNAMRGHMWRAGTGPDIEWALADCNALLAELLDARTALAERTAERDALLRVASAAWTLFQPYQATGSHADANAEAELHRRQGALCAALDAVPTAPTSSGEGTP